MASGHTFLISSRMLLPCVLAATLPIGAQTPSTFFEFGTVVALNQRTVDIQTFDAQRQRLVQHTFSVSKETKADGFRVGDTVEVIYTTTATDSAARRIVLLSAGIPLPGPPSQYYRAGSVVAPPDATTSAVPKATQPAVPGSSATRPGSKVPTPATTAGRVPAGAAPATVATARGVAVPAATSTTKAIPPSAPVNLASTAQPRVGSAVNVPLAATDTVEQPKYAKARDVVADKPAEECNRSSADWPSQPVRLAVLDFRYPTDREEAHDIGTTGGGSGTAVADLVFARLSELPEFAMSRGDRTRLYRGDFAGAARVGRELGVDAVLAGTFAPVDPPPGSDPDFPPPKSYELRAGIVDTCTGQLLLRLTSVQCPAGIDPNQSANANVCTRISVTAKAASDPKDQAHAFKAALDATLFPLEHNGPPPGQHGSAGDVITADATSVTFRIASGVKLKVGDQVAIHAWRLTKNPTTYTMHNLHDEEIGRVTLTSVQGASATGSFQGDFPPKAGDTAETVQ